MNIFKKIDEINDPGSPEKPSEDRIGYDLEKGIAWVIDGASDDYLDMVPHKDTGEPLNAYWAAGELSRLFQEYAELGLKNPRQMIDQVTRDFAKIFENSAGSKIDDIPREFHPIAAFAWIYFDPDANTLTTASLADCKAFATGISGRLYQNTTTSDPDAERKRDEKWAQETGNAHLDRTSDYIRDQLIAKRRVYNCVDEGGSKVLGPDSRCGENAQIDHIELGDDKIGHILVTSDGLMRLTDTFQEMTDKVLVEAALRKGLDYMVYKELRPREEINMQQGDTAIVKSKDDTAAAIFRINHSL